MAACDVLRLQLKGHGKGSSSGSSWCWSLLALLFVALLAAAATAFYLRDVSPTQLANQFCHTLNIAEVRLHAERPSKRWLTL